MRAFGPRHDLDYLKKGLEIGFTSVMYDGSTLIEAENIQNTKEAVRLAGKTGASVEAEIGSMGAREGGGAEDSSIYTDPAAAKVFAEATGIDALAAPLVRPTVFIKRRPGWILNGWRKSAAKRICPWLCTAEAASAKRISEE